MKAHTSAEIDKDKEVCVPDINLPVAPKPYILDERKYFCSLNFIRYAKDNVQ